MPLAAGAVPAFLVPLAVLLAASVAIAYVSHRLRLVPIVGFLLAGLVIGPRALGLVESEALVSEMAEVGVMLLLFTIGVEFSLERVVRMRRAILVGGGFKVALTLGAVAVLLVAFGVGAADALFTGGLVALSSTAIVLALLAARGETDTPAGGLALAVLLFQDFAVVGMVLLLPLLGGEGDGVGAALLVVGRAVVVTGLVAVGARTLVPALLERVAATRQPDLFLLAVVALCFGTAWAVSAVGVSIALGAFLAGLVVSESRHSEQALADLVPLRTVFQAVFFVSVGMLLDLRFVVAHPAVVVGVALGVLALKGAAAGAAVLALGFPVRIAAPVALALGGIGEFSFVLASAGAAYGLTPAGLGADGQQAFLAVSVGLMLATPFLVALGPRAGDLLARTPLGRLGDAPPDPAAAPLADHVVLVGYGAGGARLAAVLREERRPFTLVEVDPVRHAQAVVAGGAAHAIRGDATRRVILDAAGVGAARLLCLTLNDVAAAVRVVRLARAANPALQIVVRARAHAEVETLRQAGADVVVPEELETTVRLVAHVLGAYLVAPAVIEGHVRALRAGDYRILRGSIQEAHLMVLQGLDAEGLHTRAVRVAPGSPVDGRTLAALDLRRAHGLSVLAVQRAGHTAASPSGDVRLEGGDRLVLIGRPERFAEAAGLFRAPPDAA